MTSRLFACAVAVLISWGCHPSRPVVDPGPRADVGGSISGTVTASDGAAALVARTVTAVNTETGQRFDVSTTTTGAYTVRVPRGTYRLEVELRNGERVTVQPGATEVGGGDLDAGRDFVVAGR